ncbi:unnamed protein product [Musa acuminata subsp. burmannicoides]
MRLARVAHHGHKVVLVSEIPAKISSRPFHITRSSLHLTRNQRQAFDCISPSPSPSSLEYFDPEIHDDAFGLIACLSPTHLELYHNHQAEDRDGSGLSESVEDSRRASFFSSVFFLLPSCHSC